MNPGDVALENRTTSLSFLYDRIQHFHYSHKSFVSVSITDKLNGNRNTPVLLRPGI